MALVDAGDATLGTTYMIEHGPDYLKADT